MTSNSQAPRKFMKAPISLEVKEPATCAAQTTTSTPKLYRVEQHNFKEALYRCNTEVIAKSLDDNPHFYNLKIDSTLYPVHTAAIAGSTEVLELLQKKCIETGGDLDEFLLQGDSDGISMLHYACAEGHAHFVTYLLNETIPFSASPEKKRILYKSMLTMKTRDANCLLNGSIPLYVTGGKTCLMACAERAQVECFCLVIDAAKQYLSKEEYYDWIIAKDLDGNTALDLAILYGGEEEYLSSIVHEMAVALEQVGKSALAAELIPSKLVWTKEERWDKKKLDMQTRKERISKNTKKGEDGLKNLMGSYKPLHPELFSLAENLFDEAFLSAIKSGDPKQLASILKEEGPGVYSFNMMNLNFCKMLVEEAENYERSGLPIVRPNSMNNYGLILNDIGFKNMFTQFMNKYVYPLAKELFPNALRKCSINGDLLPFASHHTFLVKYKMGEDLDLDKHVDSSTVTINLSLGKEFVGGEVFFEELSLEEDEEGKEEFQKFKNMYLEYKCVPGRAVIHLGRHWHGAKQLKSGERWNLILWCRNTE